MRSASSLAGLLVGLLGGLVITGAGCNELYPFEVEPGRDRGVDLEGLDAAHKLDAATTDQGPVDAPLDAPADLLDARAPDTALPPDHGPYWDQGGGTICNELMVSPTAPIQVSKSVGTASGSAPSITAIGDTFYVAFIEDKALLVRKINATSAAVTSATYSAKLSLTGTVAAPWITYNKPGNKLALAWHEPFVSAGNCPSKLYFRELDPSSLTPGGACHLNPAYGTYGHGPASLVHDGTSYMLVTAVQYPGQACGTHAKIKFHAFSSCTALPTPYDSVSSLLSTFYPVIAATGNGTNPYAMIRLQDPGTSGNPTTLNIRPHLASSATNFPLLTSFGAEQGVLDRPSVVAGGGELWFAWTDTQNQIKLLHRAAANITPPFAISGYGRHPFLAHKPQVGASPANAKTVLALTQTDSSGSVAKAVRLAILDGAKPSVGATRTVAAASSTAYSAWSPADTVVAAGTNGFGVAWTEQVAADQREVFFQWVGCQP